MANGPWEHADPMVDNDALLLCLQKMACWAMA